jgi:hypothetical protein
MPASSQFLMTAQVTSVVLGVEVVEPQAKNKGRTKLIVEVRMGHCLAYTRVPFTWVSRRNPIKDLSVDRYATKLGECISLGSL